MMTFSPGATRRTLMSSSLSFRLMAMRPSRRVRSYRSIEVFLTMPWEVANIRYSSARELLGGDDGGDALALLERQQVDDRGASPWRPGPRGLSYTFRRYTLPRVLKNSM